MTRRSTAAVVATMLTIAGVAFAATAIGTRTSPTTAADSPSADGDLVPWAMRLAPHDAGFRPPPPSAPAPPCDPAALAPTASPAREEPVPDTDRTRVVVDVRVRNDGPACQLNTYGSATVLAQDGATVAGPCSTPTTSRCSTRGRRSGRR